ncbi:MAG TPA: HK97 family phage prohead protease [Vicinamibacterales bacterium]|nr:HK97 family phage prohead protease [Vicinamibacterales bacterium]
MDILERRYTADPVELRGDPGHQKIGGYAAVFNKLSRNLGGFVEQVAPAAFNDSRGRDWPDVRARYNHEILLGTTAARTLTLSIDATGLLYEVEPPQSRADIVELVTRGDVRHSSFAFRTIEDHWDTSDQGYPMRTLLKVQLVDVAPVDDPAYPDATAGLRSLAQRFDAEFEEVRQMAQEDELRKFFETTGTTRTKAKPKTLGAAARMAILGREQDPTQ